MATFLPADISKPARTVQPHNGKYFKLQELYKLLDCTNIEIIRGLSNDRIMVIDGEAKLAKDSLKNTRAMELVVYPSASEMRRHLEKLAASGVEVFMMDDLPDDDEAPADYIAGDVIICLNREFR